LKLPRPFDPVIKRLKDIPGQCFSIIMNPKVTLALFAPLINAEEKNITGFYKK
jgi:hypothetical protein